MAHEVKVSAYDFDQSQPTVIDTRNCVLGFLKGIFNLERSQTGATASREFIIAYWSSSHLK
jgi:hypothetical protein